MSQENTVKTVKVETADPSSLALFGLAMVTLVASSQKLGLTKETFLVIPWAIFLGGAAQLFGCIGDFKRNNVFGGTAFGAYALFWWSVALTWLIKAGLFGPVLAKGDTKQLGFAFVGYLIFSVVMTIGSAKNNKVLFAIFVFIDFLFVGLSLSTLMPGTSIAHAGHWLAAYSEIIISLLSFYLSAATVLNPHFGRVVIPTGKPFIN